MNPEQASFSGFLSFGSREKDSVSSEEQLKKLARTVVGSIRYLNAAEGVKRKTVDYDVALPDQNGDEGEDIVARVTVNPPTKEEWRKRAEIFKELKERAEEISSPRNESLMLQQQTTIAVLDALDIFCRNRGGENISTIDLIEKTQGIVPELVPEPMIEAQVSVVRYMLKNEFRIEYTRKAIEEFRQSKLEPNFVDQMRAGENVFFKTLSSLVDRQIEPNIQIDEKPEEDYWILWSTGKGSKYKTIVNTHQQHDLKKTKGRAELVRDHERMHHGQAYAWRSRIEKGELLPSLGVTSIVTPVQVTLEGIAQTIHYYAPELQNSLSPLGELELETEGVRQLIYNNVHILINTSEMTEKQVIDYVHKYYPAEPEDEIKRQIKDRTEDPFKRSYLYSYPAGYRLFRWYAHNLNSKGKKEMLKFIFNQPTTPKQVFDYFNTLLDDPNSRYGMLSVPYGETFDDLPIFTKTTT